MPLDKGTLKDDIKQAFEDQLSITDPEADFLDGFAGKLANAIEKYVKSGQIIAKPDAIAAAALSNSAGTVAAGGNLISTIE